MKYVGLVSKVGSIERCCDALGIDSDIFIVAEELWIKYNTAVLANEFSPALSHDEFINAVTTINGDRFETVVLDTKNDTYVFKIQKIRGIKND